jgi:hypothetical protein
MPEQSPAETLRAAASLLRQRAEKATPGPWKPMVLGSEGYLVHRDSGTIRERGRGRVARFGCKDWDADRADAEYVAAMHPLVGVALAGWLDRFGDKLYCYGPAEFEHALAIARAYLGETDD